MFLHASFGKGLRRLHQQIHAWKRPPSLIQWPPPSKSPYSPWDRDYGSLSTMGYFASTVRSPTTPWNNSVRAAGFRPIADMGSNRWAGYRAIVHRHNRKAEPSRVTRSPKTFVSPWKTVPGEHNVPPGTQETKTCGIDAPFDPGIAWPVAPLQSRPPLRRATARLRPFPSLLKPGREPRPRGRPHGPTGS